MAETILKPDVAWAEERILEVTRELLREAGSPEAANRVHPAISFEDDLGLKSFDLVELLIRVESAVGVKLPDHIADEAGTPAEWARVVIAASGADLDRSGRGFAAQREAPPPPRDAQNLVEVLLRHAEIEPDRLHAVFPQSRKRRGLLLSELLDEALVAAGALQERGVEPGDSVALLLPNGPDFLIFFFGVHLAGATPVILTPPPSDHPLGDDLRTHVRLLSEVRCRLLVAGESFGITTRLLRRHVAQQTQAWTPSELRKGARPSARFENISPVAAILVSPGADGAPRGVPVTHQDILSNLNALSGPLGIDSRDSVVNWLPLSTAFGLINGWLLSLYNALPVTILDTAHVVRHPDAWLWAISQSGATISLAHDSGYDLCARRAPSGALEGLDLSRWRVALSAGEFVRTGTLEYFAERFQPFGFNPLALTPAYGLAETAGIFLLGRPGRPFLRERVDRDRLERGGEIAIAPDGERALEFVSSGVPLEDFEVSLVDQNGQAVPEAVVGRLLYRRQGKASMRGSYWGDSAVWRDSGDLAYSIDGEVRIVGRCSDLVRYGDRFLLPQFVEALVETVPGVRPRGCAMVQHDLGAGVGYAAVVETTAAEEEDIVRVRQQVSNLLREKLPGQAVAVELVERDQIPRSPLGLIRRSRARQMLVQGRLQDGGRLEKLTLYRLRAEGACRGGLKRLQRVALAFLDLYYRILLFVVPVIGGLCMRVLGDRRVAGSVMRWTARAILLLSGHRVPKATVFAPRRDGPHLLVANRCGKYDPLLLAATLPLDVVFADQVALRGLPAGVRFLMRPLVLERRSLSGTNLHPEAVTEALRDGASVVVFPDCSPGAEIYSCGFRLDAFVGALAHRAPVTPILLRNTSGLFQGSDQPDRMSMIMGDLVHFDGFGSEQAEAVRRRARLALAALADQPTGGASAQSAAVA